MTDSAEGRHPVNGDAAAARSWIEQSTLPDEDKAGLRRFVDHFPSLTFVREDNAALSHYEETDEVTLPPWFRETRSALAFTVPGAQVRVDGFRWDDSPRSDDQEDHWYEVEPGYVNEENRETMFDLARLYPIGQWFANDRSYLAVDLEDVSNRRILEFALEDLWDDEAKGEPLRESTFPAYSSYADFLGHVVAVKLPDGTLVEAQD
ncbi:hypothetical protein [Micromonospora sp. NPDC093277]|uniref:hypothetical protein n=1 Tax=Micromonospora sp. NPDC093277 TaxID=3364291 RepID=UPI0037FDA226